MNKVYRSLFLIILINIGGYIVCAVIIIYILIPIENQKPLSYVMFMIIPGVILSISIVSNAPILFINSTDYNKAYKKELILIKQKLMKLFGINQQMFTTTAVILLNQNK
uniref:G_PROTEIN_RECEP_F1_2 domain-containing protein n=1 Tax=Meloidogyne hapla TaxID=6305 RepID=A0A1I8BZZ1_MELHA